MRFLKFSVCLIVLYGVIFSTSLFVSAATFEKKDNIASNKVWTVTFNEAYDPSVNLNDYVEVVQDGLKINIEVDGGEKETEIKISPPQEGYEPNKEYYIHILKGFPSTSDRVLEETVVMAFNVNEEIEAIAFEPREDSKNEIILKEDVIELDDADINSLIDDESRLLLNVPDRSLLAEGIKKGTIITLPATYDYPFGRAIKVTSIAYDQKGKIIDLKYVDAELMDYIDNVDVSMIAEDLDINPDFFRYPNAEERTLNGVKFSPELPAFNVDVKKDSFSFSFENLGIAFDENGKEISNSEDDGDYDGKIKLTLGGELSFDNITPAMDIGWDWYRPVLKSAEVYADATQNLNANVTGNLDMTLEPLLVEVPIPYAGIGTKNIKAGLFFQVYLKMEMGINGNLQYSYTYSYSMHSKVAEKKGKLRDQTKIGKDKPKHDLAGYVDTHVGIGIGVGLPFKIGNSDIIRATADVMLEGDMKAGMLNWGEFCAEFDAGVSLNSKWTLGNDEWIFGSADFLSLKYKVISTDYTTCKSDVEINYDIRSGKESFSLPKTISGYETVIAANESDVIHFNVDDQEENLLYSLLEWNEKDKKWKHTLDGELHVGSNGVYIPVDKKAGYKVVLRTKGTYYSTKNFTFNYEILDRMMYEKLRLEPVELELSLVNRETQNINVELNAGEGLQVISKQATGIEVDLYYENEDTGKRERIDNTYSSSGNINYTFFATKAGNYTLDVYNYSKDKKQTVLVNYQIILGDLKEYDNFTKARVLLESGIETFTLHANGDYDYFEVDLTAGEALQAITKKATGIEADLYYKNEATGKWDHVDDTYSSSGNINKSFMATKTGKYVLRLNRYSGYSFEEVQLEYAVKAGDAKEYDSFTKARALLESGIETFTLHANGDYDYFEVDLTAGEALQAITKQATGIEADFYYKNEATGKWDHIDDTYSSSGNINKSFMATKTGKYVLRLNRSSGYSFEEVQLEYTVKAGDAKEYDSFTKARALLESGIETFTFHANGDYDYFEVDLTAGEALQAITKQATGIEADFYYKNEATGKWDHVDDTYSSSGNINKSFMATKTGKYVLRLNRSSGYSFEEVQLEYAVKAGDAKEYDSFTKARALLESGIETFTFHANGDYDYFEVDLTAGEALQAITKQATGIEADFYYKNEATGKWDHVDDTYSSSGNINKSFMATKTGKYVLRLNRSSGYSFDEVQLEYIVK